MQASKSVSSLPASTSTAAAAAATAAAAAAGTAVSTTGVDKKRSTNSIIEQGAQMKSNRRAADTHNDSNVVTAETRFDD